MGTGKAIVVGTADFSQAMTYGMIGWIQIGLAKSHV